MDETTRRTEVQDRLDAATREEELATLDLLDSIAEFAREMTPVTCVNIGLVVALITIDVVANPFDGLRASGEWGPVQWIVAALAGAAGWLIVMFGSGNFGIRPEDR